MGSGKLPTTVWVSQPPVSNSAEMEPSVAEGWAACEQGSLARCQADLYLNSLLQTQSNKRQKQMCFKGERVMWIQPTTLNELVALKSQYPNAKLVVGNTEVGKRRS